MAQKAVINPTLEACLSRVWYAPLSGIHVEVEPETDASFRVVSKPICDAQNIDPVISSEDLTFEDNGTSNTSN